MSRLLTYQAQLSLPASLARVREISGGITRIGGQVEIIPTRVVGVTIVRLHLPLPYTPEQILPGLPFYRE